MREESLKNQEAFPNPRGHLECKNASFSQFLAKLCPFLILTKLEASPSRRSSVCYALTALAGDPVAGVLVLTLQIELKLRRQTNSIFSLRSLSNQMMEMG